MWNQMPPQVRLLSAAVVGLALMLSVAGCTGTSTSAPSVSASSPSASSPSASSPSASSPSASSPSASGAAAAQPTCAGLGNITLKVLSGEDGEGRIASWKESTAAFEQANPSVKVNVTYEDFSTFLKNAKLITSGNNPPDVFSGNQGWALDGALVKAGLVLNLDQYAAAFGWDKTFSEALLAPLRWATDGSSYGSGSLYGVSRYWEFMGVYFNRTLLANIGITDPSTLDSQQAFENALAKAKAAGLTPILAGDADGWPLPTIASSIRGWYIPAKTHNDWVYGLAGSTFDDQAHQAAAAELQDWMTKGYFNSDMLAISSDDSIARMGKGGAVFRIDGNWATDAMNTAMGSNGGWILFPAGADGKHVEDGTVSVPMHISSKTKYPDCAAAYVNFMTTSEVARQSLLDHGTMPVGGVPSTAKPANAVTTAQIAGASRLLADGTSTLWTDWTTPTMADLIFAQNQLLVAGKVTPAQYTKAIQDDWAKFYTK